MNFYILIIFNIELHKYDILVKFKTLLAGYINQTIIIMMTYFEKQIQSNFFILVIYITYFEAF